MSETKPILGQNGMLFIWDADATTPDWKPIGCFTSNSYNADGTVNEQPSTKCNPYEVRKTEGGTNYTLSGDAEVFDTDGSSSKDSYKELHAIKLTGGIQDWKYDTNTEDSDSLKIFAKGFLTTLELTQENEQNSTFSLTIDIDGKPALTDPFGV